MPADAAPLHRSSSHNFALLPESSAVEPEHDRNGNHHSREAGEQSPSPLNAQVGEHLTGEEWEAGCDYRSEHDVGGYGGSGAVRHVVSFLSFPVVNLHAAWEDLHRKISVHQVIETRHEDAQHSSTGENSGGCRGHPVD
jgi:hypothetical protein